MKAKARLTLTWLLILMAAAIGTAAAADKSVTLRWAHFVPNQPETYVIADQQFANRVEELTGGQVKIQIFYGQTLGNVKELLGLVSNGTVDIASFAAGFFTSAFPLWAAPNNLPFTMSTLDQAYRAAVELPALSVVQEELKRQNLKLLFSHVLPPYQVFSTKPLEKFEDWKGLKVRTWGAYMPKAYDVAGAVAVNVFPAEVYDSLKRGVVNAAMWSLELGLLQRHYEVAPYVCMWNIGSFVGWGNWINLKTWEKLSPAHQEAMTRAAEEARKIELDTRARQDAEARKKLESLGAKFVEVSAGERQRWIDASPNFMDEWVGEMNGMGLGDAARQLKAQWLQVIGR